ncbi:hypothetical protein [Paraburkholderia fungorum]
MAGFADGAFAPSTGRQPPAHTAICEISL